MFQHGVGAGRLGFQQADTIEASVPLFLFSVLFGLSQPRSAGKGEMERGVAGAIWNPIGIAVAWERHRAVGHVVTPGNRGSRVYLQERAKPSDADIVSVMANDAFRALAHPIRRRIVERLVHGPATIGEATRDFGVSKPTISRHVRVLEEAGVVVRTIDGRTHFLGLDLDALGEAVEWIDRQRAIWERMFDVVDDYLGDQKEAR